MGRNLTFEIFRYNPNQPSNQPWMQPYQIQETPGMTLFLALTQIREEKDPSLMFDFVCRAGVCGSCAMVVNGIQRMACRTLTRDLSSHIRLLPLPIFKLVGDLKVDTGVWFKALNTRIGSWIHSNQLFDHKKKEPVMSNQEVMNIYEAERCIECGICIASCGTFLARKSFLGAAGLNHLARLLLDPRDQRDQKKFLELISSDEGVFCCFETLACEDNCPLGLSLDIQMEFVQRKLGFIV